MDKTIELIRDVTDTDSGSSCCGAAIYMEDICADCGEHCGVGEDE